MSDHANPERIGVARAIAAEPAASFALLRDPHGHIAIDAGVATIRRDRGIVRRAPASQIEFPLDPPGFLLSADDENDAVGSALTSVRVEDRAPH